jgi:hypothetical protein
MCCLRATDDTVVVGDKLGRGWLAVSGGGLVGDMSSSSVPYAGVEHALPNGQCKPFVWSGKMNEQEFQTKLAELMGEISTLPATERAKLEKLADETRQRHERLRQTVSSLQESLDYLRLSIKYLVFDLEATRRENGYLRKMLEETTGNNE